MPFYGEYMQDLEIIKVLTFLRHAENLKNTLRSAHTSQGRSESSAEHSWRVALMALVLHKEFPEASLEKMLSMALVHDLAEAICGDTPAPLRKPQEDKKRVERQGLLALCKALPEEQCASMVALWDEYEAGQSLEAQLVKAFDKLETLLQHTQGLNPQNFDYQFNMTYGMTYTSVHPLLQEIRAHIDCDTRKRLQK